MNKKDNGLQENQPAILQNTIQNQRISLGLTGQNNNNQGSLQQPSSKGDDSIGEPPDLNALKITGNVFQNDSEQNLGNSAIRIQEQTQSGLTPKNKQEYKGVPIKTKEFQYEQPTIVNKYREKIDQSGQAVIRRKQSPAQKRVVKPNQRVNDNSKDSLLMNSYSHAELSIEGLQQSPMTVPLSSHPQTQGGQNPTSINQVKKDQAIQLTFARSGFNTSSQMQEEPIQMKGVQIQSRAVSGQVTPDKISDGGEKGAQESTDLEKINSRHYHDYLTNQFNNVEQIKDIKIDKNMNLEALGFRKNSQVGNLSNRKGSKLFSEQQTIEHDFTIEEIKKNQIQSISRVLDPYLSEKLTLGSVANLEAQMKRMVLPHSYESYRKQKRSISPTELRRAAGGIAVRTIVNNSHLYIKDPLQKDQIEESFAKRLLANQVGRVINAQTQVKVPKDLILMKIAQKQMELQKKQFVSERKMSIGFRDDQSQNNMYNTINDLRSSLPPAAKTSRLMPIEDLNQNSSILDIDHNKKFPDLPNRSNSTSKNSNLLRLINQRSDLNSQLLQNNINNNTISSTKEINFNITDLLKQSTARADNNLQATIDYYKRSVKTDNELQMKKEIIIKNYRLRVIDANKDITPEDRKLMLLNKGTSIYVANSLIKPEIYRYSTKVSNTMAEVFVEMQSNSQTKNVQSLVSPSVNNYETLTFQDELELNTALQQEQVEQLQSDTISNNIKRTDSQPITPDQQDNNINRSQIRGQQNVSTRVQQIRATPFTAQLVSTASQHQRSENSRGVSSGLYYEQGELQAMMYSKNIVDQWLQISADKSYNMIQESNTNMENKNIYDRVNSDQNRQTLANGLLAPLSLKEIETRMTDPKVAQIVLQPRIMPIEDYTAVTQFSDKPYLHLMRSIIMPDIRRKVQDFINKTTKYIDQSPLLKTHQNPVVQVIDYPTQLEAVQFMRIDFTHLDPQLVQDCNVSQDLFFEQYELDDLIERLKNRQADEVIQCKTDFMFVNQGQYKQGLVDFEVINYDPTFRTFVLKNDVLKVQTTRSRFNLQLDTDPDDFIESNRQRIDYWRDQTQQYMRVTRLIQTELLKRYGNHQFNDDLRQRILKRVGDITQYYRSLIDRVVIQVEALYVFALMKSTLSSQRNDPFVKNMLLNFQVAMDSEAIYIEPQTFKTREDLHPGVKQFRFTAIKNELSKSSISMSNKKYMQLPKLMYEITWQAINDQKDRMFIAPIPPNEIINFGDNKYRKMTINQINEKFNTYPLEHTQWIEAQKVIQEQFQKLMKQKWSEVIAQKIWFFIKEDFEFDMDKGFTESQIDPNLIKIFNKIKSYQQTILYEVFELGIRAYMRFLLGFALRDEQIKKSKVIQNIKKADQLRLINDDPNFVPLPNTDINDLDLIPLQLKPFVKLHAEIQISGKMRNRKYKVITVPELDSIHRDFITVIKNLHDSTRQLKRVEAVVFPLLDLQHPYIMQPDIKNNPKIVYILKLIDKLLDQCMHGCKISIQRFQTYISIFSKKVDGIILELKKQSFALANEGSEEEEFVEDAIIENDGANDVASPPELQQKKINRKISNEESSAEEKASEDESDQEGGGFQGNAMAYKSVDIDENLMKLELDQIRQHRYAVMAEVSHSYDFGFLNIDCTPFKQSVIQHCLDLEKEIQNYLTNEFSEKMRNVTSEINALKGRLDEHVSSIDDVIALLAYIDTLKKQDNKVEEIADYIEVMNKKAEYIDSIKIMFPEEMKLRFLHMRNWPRTFDSWLKSRKGQLIKQKEQLIAQMKVQTDEVWAQVADFKKQIADLLQKGLRSVNSEQRAQRTKLIETLFQQLHIDNIQQIPPEIPHEIVFQWLACETNWVKNRFDPNTVQIVFRKINQLKKQFEDLDRQTILINKRQALLGIERTEFKDQKVILDDLKPLHNLWTVAESFNNSLVDWFEGPLERLDYQVMENQMEEWFIEMKRLQKSNLIINNAKQMELLQFLLDSLVYIKKYQGLIRTTRVKGLTARHWRQINAELGVSIDPLTTSLFRMIGMELFKEDRIKVIKGISDIAQKEYAIQLQTEQLDQEMRAIEFEFSNGMQLDVRILIRIEQITVKFNEFLLRVQVLKMNPYMKNFFDKLLDIEKIAKSVNEIIQEFTTFQDKWVYLNTIFSSGSLSDGLQYEIKIWKGVDRFFKTSIKQMHDMPQIFKITLKEGYLATLRKQNIEIDNCREGLNRFLEQKRQLFPRFYFLSDEELLMVYGRLNELIDTMIEGKEKTFINSIFEGFDRLIFNKMRQIIAIQGRDGEQIQLNSPVNTTGIVEKWLQIFETQTITSMKKYTLFAYQDMDQDLPQIPEEIIELKKFKQSNQFKVRKVDPEVLREWVGKWPGQATYLCQQIWFNQKIISVFQGALEKAKYVDSAKRIQKQNILMQLSASGILPDSESSSEDSDEYKSLKDNSEDESVPQQTFFQEKEINEKTTQSKNILIDQDQTNDVDQSQEFLNDPESQHQGESQILSKKSSGLASDKKIRSRLGVVDRALRFWDRFCINELQHPAEVLSDIRSGVLQKIKHLIQFLNQKLKQYSYNSSVALITCCIYQRDQIQHMIEKKLFKLTDFEWEIQFKFTLERLNSVFRQISGLDLERKQKLWEDKLEIGEIEVKLDIFNFSKMYGFQYFGNVQRLVISPLTLKTQRSMFMAMQFQFASSIEGPFGTGKTETVRDMANLLARQYHTINTSTDFEYRDILKLLKGITASGAWICFDEFNRMELSMMNYITQVITQIQNSIRGEVRMIFIDEQKINIDPEATIFITMNPGYAGRVELPINLKNLFRPIQMVVPDWALITEIMLARCGFLFGNDLSKKITHVQKLANELMQKYSHVKKDFGLRAIRAIVSLAQSLKRQCQNLEVSEMPDIINQHTMSQINWNEQKLVNEVMQELTSIDESTTEIPQIYFGSPSNVSMKQLSSQKPEKDQQSQKQSIHHNSSKGEGFNLRSSSKVIINVESIDSIQIQNKSLADLNNEEVKSNVLNFENFQGLFFDQAFKTNLTRQQRQIRSLYAQIGIEGDNPTEQELEESIVIKAIKVFNCSKFADQDHAMINGIINDVFSQNLNSKSQNINIMSSETLKQDTHNSIQSNVQNQKSDYGNLRELLQRHLINQKLDYNITLEQKCYQMLEVTHVKSGCIILGQTQSAKSILIQTLAGALNQASLNELKLRIAQIRRERLIQAVLSHPQLQQLLPPAAIKKLSKQIKIAQTISLASLSQSQFQDKIPGDKKTSSMNLTSNFSDNQTSQKDTNTGFNPHKVKKLKLNDKQKLALWQELYATSKLDRLEIFALEQELVIKGAKIKRINPKSISKSELIGEIASGSCIWNEGLLTQVLRQYAQDTSSIKQWVHLDGPLDHDWAENLNSLLDENKKINLPNGEVIKVNQNTCLIFETDSLKNLTPATVSRCGLVHLNRENVNRPKYIFNQYLNRLPPNLGDNVKDIESQVNYLLPSCLQVFKEEKLRGTLLLNQIDEFWIMQSFIKFFDSFIQSYWIDFIAGNKSDWEDAPQQTALRNCLFAHGYPQPAPDLVAEAQEDSSKLDPEILESEFKAMKISSATNVLDDGEQRIAHNDFISNEQRLENSLKFLPIWIEAFIISSIISTFGPILDRKAQIRISDLIKVKYEERKGDFATFQKNKKKIQQAKEEQKKREQKALFKALVNSGLTGQTNNINMNATGVSNTFNKTGVLPGMNETKQSMQSQSQQQSNIINTINNLGAVTGFTTDFVEPTEEIFKPMFITDFPFNNEHGLILFDYYFNLDNTQWVKFDDQGLQSRMYLNFSNVSFSQQNVQNLAVPTVQWAKYYYMMECLIIAQKPILICGQRATGKSTLVKDMIFNQTASFSNRIIADHISCTFRTNQASLKEHVQRNLSTIKLKITNQEKEEGMFGESDTERPLKSVRTHDDNADANHRPRSQGKKGLADELHKQMKQNVEPKRVRPAGQNVSILLYVEDVHLTKFDEFQDNSAAETLRDLISYRRWFSTKKRAIRQIEGVNVIGCMNTADPSQNKLSERLLRQFSVISIELLDEKSCFTILNKILDIHGTIWPSQIQGKIRNICAAVFDLYRHCADYLRPTPIKVQYTFNQREMFKIVSSICKVEGNYLKGIDNVTRLFFHEAMRQFGDLILMKHDLRWFIKTLKAVCVKNFYDKDVSTFDFGRILLPDDQSDDEELFADIPVKEPKDLWFSILNEEVEGYYLEASHPKKLRYIIERSIERYNEQPDLRKLNLVLYDELYRHLFKIIRALNIHGGNLIIVGLKGFATGELIKLATFITNKNYSTLELHPEFEDTDWKQTLRHKIIETGQDDKQVCFVIEEQRMKNPDWYRDVETLMTCNIHSAMLVPSDLPTILSALKLQHRRLDRSQVSGVEANLDVDAVNAVQNEKKLNSEHISLAMLVKENIKIIQGNPILFNELYQSLLQRVRKNLHFVLTFTPSGENFRKKMLNNLQLMHNSQIIWIQDLKGEDLLQIGEQVFLDKIESKQTEEQIHDTQRDTRLDAHKKAVDRENNRKVLKAMVQIYLTTVQFAKKYQDMYQHCLYFTPVFFLRSLTAYRRLLVELKRNVTETQNRYFRGLDRIKTSVVEITQFKQELEQKTPVLIKKQKKIVVIIVDIQAQIDRLNEQRNQAMQQETQLTSNNSEAKKNLQDCQYAMDSIVPALNSSLAQMQKISKYELAEIRSMQRPPKLVKLVMKAICIILDIEPVMKTTKEGKQKLSYWRAANSTLLLADPNLPEKLEKFDRSKCTNEKMAIIEELMSDPDYTYEAIKKSCFAIENLYIWLKGLRDYHYIFKELEPRKLALQNAQKVFQQAQAKSEKKHNQILGIDENLASLNQHLDDKKKDVEDLRLEIEDQIVRKKRADVLLRCLSQEKQKWVVCSRLLETNSQTLTGDVVLSAALINYGGGFTFSYRRQLIEKWQAQALKVNSLNTTENFQLQELFGDNFKIRDWHHNGLSKDILNTENAIIMEKTKQYCMCIDPQQQASIWLKAQYSQQGMFITKLTDPSLKRTLEVAIDLGKIVLIENVPLSIDIHIESLVKQEISKHQDSRMIKFCRKQLKFDKEFRLIMVTNLPRPQFDVNYTNYTTLVNFSISVEGLSQNLLSLVVANERKDLEEDFNTSLDTTFNSVKDLKEIENQLLQRLEKFQTNDLLSDDSCIQMLRESAKTSETISANLRKMQQTNQFLEKSRALYTPVAFRAATLYYGIQDLDQINPMYQFGLQWFLAQFKSMFNLVNQLSKQKPSKNKATQETLAHQDQLRVTIQNEEFAILDVKASPQYRCELLMSTFTQEIIRKVIFSVFQVDRQFITYFLALRILQAEQLTDDNLISFAISGSKYVTEPDQNFKNQNKLQWLTHVMWSDLQFLQNLHPFSDEILSKHILQNQEKWNNINYVNSIEFERLPNSNLINLDQFPVIDIRDAIEAVDKKLQITLSDFNTNQKSNTEEIVQPNLSKQRSQNEPKTTKAKKVYTEEQILADESIWLVSEGDDDEEYNYKERNVEFYQEESSLTDEEKVMARYMTERAPGALKGNQDFESMHTMTKKEQRSYDLRQIVLKRTIEMSIAKCLRPDLIQACMHSLVATIYNFNYSGFQNDILSKFIDFDGTLSLRKIHTPSAQFVSMPIKEKADNNIQLLISDCYSDSTSLVPVLFLISHSVDLKAELIQFHSNFHLGNKLNAIFATKNGLVQYESLIRVSMINGDWLFVQNLHMEESWIEIIETQIQKFGPEINPKFRLWLSMTQIDNCSQFILKSCVKVALEQPINIKMKIERHLNTLKEGIFRRGQESGTFHKNIFLGLCYLHGVLDGRRFYGPFGWHILYEFDKNDFEISDSLLNIYLKKDLNLKLEYLQTMKYIFSNINFAGKISRSEDQRKLQAHVEDLFNEKLSLAYETQIDLDASHFGFPSKDLDLINHIENEMPSVDHYRIFGFNQNIQRFNQKKIANQITSRLKQMNQKQLKDLGFADIHVNLENQLKRFTLQRTGQTDLIIKQETLISTFVQLQQILSVSSLDQTIEQESDRYDERVNKDLLPQRDLADRKVQQLVKNIKEMLVNLYTPSINIKDEKLVNISPIHYVLLKELHSYNNLRDIMLQTVDEFLTYVAGDGVMPLQTEMLWLKIQNNQIPQTWLNNSYDTAHTSLVAYLADFVQRVQFWNEFFTSKISRRVYLISAFYQPRQFLFAKVQEIARQTNTAVRNLQNKFTVSKFYDPIEAEQSLTEQINENKVSILYGLWLEGADWDVKKQILVEQKDINIQQRFPVLEMRQVILQNSQSTYPYDEDDEFYNDNPQPSQQEVKEQQKQIRKQEKEKAQAQEALKKQKRSKEITPKQGNSSEVNTPIAGTIQKEQTTMEQLMSLNDIPQKYYTYQCPVFHSTNRLSLGGVGEENKALFYVELRSHIKPRTWVKRSVALLMEPSVLE